VKYALAEPCSMSMDDLSALIAELEQMPDRIATLLQGLTDGQLRCKPSPAPQDFSFVEHMHHLRDIEVMGYARRLRRTLVEEVPKLPDIDGTRLAVEQAYNLQPMAPALHEFVAARRGNLELLRRVTTTQLVRSADLESTGIVTLAQLLVLWRRHDAVHVSEMTDLRLLVDR